MTVILITALYGNQATALQLLLSVNNLVIFPLMDTINLIKELLCINQYFFRGYR